MAAPFTARCLASDAWPAGDLEAWTWGCTPGDPFDDAPRRGAMHGLGIGQELVWRGGVYRIELGSELVKTNKPDRFDLPERLIPYVRRYLDEIRPTLLDGRIDDALWINRRGTRLTDRAIQHIVAERSQARFGYAFGPHAFRDALATTAALRAPGNPALAAAVLGVSTGIVERHYNRAGQLHAVRSLTAMVERRGRALAARWPRAGREANLTGLSVPHKND